MMKEESVLNVLMYLFKYHMHEEGASLETLEENLVPELEDAGFHRPTIYQAFDWLANLAEKHIIQVNDPSISAFRVLSAYEANFISPECQSFIVSLELSGILSPYTRELVIHQVLELGAEGIDLSLVKWVTLLVLFNQPEESNALACMEYLVLSDDAFVVQH